VRVSVDGNGLIRTPPDDPADESTAPRQTASGPARHERLISQLRKLVTAINEGDDAMVEHAIQQLTERHRIYAPLGMVVGALSMLLVGVKLLFSNWRLTVVQVLPAVWIWLAMLDLKGHILEGGGSQPLHGWALVAAVACSVVITAASFFLNAVFAFAIAKPGRPEVGPGFVEARSHAGVVLGWGAVVGFLLGLAAFYVYRFGSEWFIVSMSIMIGVMMFAYVALPSRLIGLKTTYSKVDALKATAVGGTLGVIVCAPAYVLGRLGILMLGSQLLFVPGIILLITGVVVQTGAVSAIKAIKMSAKLVAGTR
jgi:hypothetical protein